MMQTQWDAFLETDLATETREAALWLREKLPDWDDEVARVLTGQVEPTGKGLSIRALEQRVRLSRMSDEDETGEKTQSDTLATEHEKSQESDEGLLLARTLRMFVEYVNRTTEQTIPLPSVPVKLPAQPSQFTPESPGLMARGHGWHQGIARWLESGPPLSGRSGVGALIVSAALNGGLVDKASLVALARQASEKLPVVADRGFLDLSLRWRGNDNMEHRRWFPDPISECLFLRLSVDPDDVPQQRKPKETLWPAIKHWFRQSRDYVDEAPRNFSEFLRVCEAFNFTELPADVGAYARRSLVSHSLRTSVWCRLHGIYTESVDELPADQSMELPDDPEYPDGPEAPLENVEWATGLWSALKAPDKTSVAQRLRRLLEENAYLPESTANLLTRWALALCTGTVVSGNRIKISTIQKYLRETGKRIAALCGSADIRRLSDLDLEELYHEVIADSTNLRIRDRLRSGLREFHHFLHSEYGMSPLAQVAQLGGGSTLHPVDANLISLDEYYEIRNQIRNADLELKAPELPVILELLFILGFRCGVRRMEALRLRIEDVHLLGESEILVRPYEGHGLKTTSSRRKVPLYALLEEDEMQLLRDWWSQCRERQRSGFSSDALFSMPSKGWGTLQADSIFEILHTQMRRVTGDASLRYHHLRHSFASWTFLRLKLAEHGKSCVLFPEQPKTEAWLERSSEFKARLLGCRNRPDLYAVARLLGHSGPGMSLEHYIHTLDLAALAIDQRRVECSSSTLIAASAIADSTVYRFRNQSGVERLLQRVRSEHPDKVMTYVSVANPEKAVEDPEQRLFLEKLDIAERYLKFRHKTSFDIPELANRFNLPEPICEAIEDRVEYLTGLRSNDKRVHSSRHRFVESTSEEQSEGISRLSLHTEPRSRSSKAAYREYARRVSGLLEEQPDFVWSVVDHYIHNQWKTRDALVFRNPRDPALAVRYIRFLERLGFPRSQLRFFNLDPAQRSSARARWRKALRLSARDIIEQRQPTNRESLAVRNWLFIAPDLQGSKGNVDDQLFGYRYLMVLLAMAKPLFEHELNGAPDGTGITAVPDPR